MAAFNEQAFEQKLNSLKDTQDSINALSSWCLQNKEHHKKIVSCWLHCFKRVKVEQRLSLFYLANDVIQYSRKKHLDFVDSWGTALQKATPLVRDDKIRPRIMRIFKIWEERGVYDETFIGDLCGLLATNVKKKTETISSDPADFQPNSLVKKIRECNALESNTDGKYKRVKDNKLPLTDAESMRMSLKDRRHGSDIVAEVDSGVKKMEAYVKALEQEITCRELLVKMLQQAAVFYETQRSEAKIVANAYRSFGGRLKAKQKALEDLLPTLLSPLPSPDINAPSPSPDSDLDAGHPSLANGADIDFSFVNSSFIGSAQFLDLHKDMFSAEQIEMHPNDLASETVPQLIEVIGGRESMPGLDASQFLKSLMPGKEQPLQPPPMPPVFGDWGASAPWAEPPVDTPQSPPMYEKQAPHIQPLEYDDSMPVPPVPDIDQRSILSIHANSNSEMDSIILPGLDMDHRVPPPTMSLDVPPPSLSLDIDHRCSIPIDPSNNLTLDQPPPSHLSLDRPPNSRVSIDQPPPHLGIDQVVLDHSLSHMQLNRPPPHLGMEIPLSHINIEPPPIPMMQMDVFHSSMNADQVVMKPPSPRLTMPLNRSSIGSERGAVLTRGPPTEQNKPSRNLISLTGSPSPSRGGNYSWHSQEKRDTDGRFNKDVNVDHIDMEVSEEDEEESQIRSGGNMADRRPFPRSMDAGVDERLGGMHCAGAKIIPPAEPNVSEKNGYNSDFIPRWRTPRPTRPQRSFRPPSNYRGFSPHNFRPRGRW